ncbi:uncharacterized protein [Rutidosis leptorrhynchoides]|uniref:uncharacterized protein n=1 Tax=Rutidosis leptorrhynchoides TaxID=125765 RepID=UPI003A9A4954
MEGPQSTPASFNTASLDNTVEGYLKEATTHFAQLKKERDVAQKLYQAKLSENSRLRNESQLLEERVKALEAGNDLFQKKIDAVHNLVNDDWLDLEFKARQMMA